VERHISAPVENERLAHVPELLGCISTGWCTNTLRGQLG
jgi:hypothetical protein